MSDQVTQSKLKDWHRQDVMAAIRKKGTTLAELGRHHGYENSTTMYNVFKMHYPKVERIIANFLDKSPEEIWPTRYHKPKVDFKTSSSKAHTKVA